MAPDGQTDHDLLVTAGNKLDSILSRLDDHSRRIDRLEGWRAAHSEASAVLTRRVDVLASGDSSHGADIEQLALWQAEMRGVWTTVRVEMALLGTLSGLSVILEILRLTGALH